ncbi:polycystin-1-like protein 3 [Rhinoderma darwinii]|uniref:polycystin-1-like protein 3 n=1 Tax=Rhinoderma darwinii TaxID=43563 RepID=UPI003F67153C
MWALYCLVLVLLTERHVGDAQCPGNQKNVGGHCIQLVNQELTYADAKSWCQKQAGKLAQIGNQKTLEEILLLIRDEGSYWIEVVSPIKDQMDQGNQNQGSTKGQEGPKNDIGQQEVNHRENGEDLRKDERQDQQEDQNEAQDKEKGTDKPDQNEEQHKEEQDQNEEQQNERGKEEPEEPREEPHEGGKEEQEDPREEPHEGGKEEQEYQGEEPHEGGKEEQEYPREEPQEGGKEDADHHKRNIHDQHRMKKRMAQQSSGCTIIYKGTQEKWRIAPACEDKKSFICSFDIPKINQRHIIKGRALCLWGICFFTKKSTTTKRPAVTKPKGNSAFSPPNLNAITPLQQETLDNMTLDSAKQITSEIVAQLVKVAPEIWIVSLVSQASDILTQLLNVSDLLSPETQVNASDLLLTLGGQLSGSVIEDVNISSQVVIDAAQSLVNAFDITMKASLDNFENLTSDQVIWILESSVASMDYVQGALLSLGNSSVQNHSFSSDISSMTVARVMSSELTSGPFITDLPAACRVTFPSSSTLRENTAAYGTVNLMLLALSVNPFRHLNPLEIVGPVVNILLGSDEGGIDIQNMTEYIEIVLIRNQSSPSNESKTYLTKDKNIILTVNVTSANHSVVLKVEPELPVQLILYLGFEKKPNSSFFLQNISLPDGGLYTWVLTADRFVNGTGVYYINVTLNNGSIWEQRTSLAYSVSLFAAQCVFWDEDSRIWNDYGCYVGPRSTESETHCLCNHLTFFASSFLVMPHVVDLSDSLMLFANVANNPVGLALLGSLVGFFLIVLFWAWKKDKADLKNVRVAILTDNDPAFHHRYMVKVCTGYRMGSGTTSQVVLTLYGSEGQSDPHLLSDSGKRVFHRGSVDVFLLKTRNLGELHSLRLWHSNSGVSPSWYVYRVSVTDLVAQKTWYFLCDSWLSADFADCQMDRIFASASNVSLMSLRYLLFSGTVEKFLKDHLWLSVWTRCPWSPFTRMQRICCCMCLLFCGLVINIMFWNDHSDEDSQTGKFFITFTQIKISFQSSAILLPVNLLIVQMFQLIQVQVQQVTPTLNKLRVSLAPKPPTKEAAAQQLLKELKGIVDYLQKYIVQVLGESADDLPSPQCDAVLAYIETLSRLVESYICVPGESSQSSRHVTVITPHQWHYLHYLYKILENLQYQVSSVDLDYVPKPIDYLQASNILFDLKELLQSFNVSGAPLPSSLTTSFPVTTNQKRCCRMPKFFTFLCWFFLFAISSFSAYYMVLISLDMTKDKAISWLISILLSLMQSIFIIPPIKVFAQTIFMYRILKRSNIEDSSEEQQLYGILGLLGSRADWELSGFRDPSNPAYQAPTNKNTTSLKKQRSMESKLYKLIHEIVVHLILLITTMLTVYAEKGPNEFNLYMAISRSFSTLENIQSMTDFYSWSRGTLLPNLFTKYPGFITDGNCYLLGSPRIRQMRRLYDSAGNQKLYHMEDTSNYGPRWSTLGGSNASADMWTYHTVDELGGHPVWTQLGYYPGGGYVAELGLNRSSAESVITNMETSKWLDSYTKAIFVEFNVYNANINLFCLATFILETTVIGGLFPSSEHLIMRLYQTTDGITTVKFVSEMLFIVILVYIIIVQVVRLKQQKWSYFCQTRNLLDLAIIAISCANTALYIKRAYLRERDIERYHADRTRFVSFYETATIDAAHGYGIAFLVSLLTIKLWRLLNLNPNLHLITVTLQKAWNQISGFLLTILILLVAYSISCNLLFGWTITSYRTVTDSAVTIISLLIGIFNYDEVISLDPILGSLLIFTCVLFLVFIVVNIFLSALMNVFSSERKNPTPYEEKEIVDMLLLKLSGLLGVQKKAEDTGEAKEKQS